MNSTKNYYKILGLNNYATIDEIKKAYKKLALMYHPDRTPYGDENKFRLISEAYSVLSNSEKKMRYDMGKSVQPIYNPFGMFNVMNKNMRMMDQMLDMPNCKTHTNSNYVMHSSSFSTGSGGKTVTKQYLYTNKNGKEDKKSRIITRDKNGLIIEQSDNGIKKKIKKTSNYRLKQD